MVLNNPPFTEVEVLKNEVAELNKQYYTALKRIKELIEENTRLRDRPILKLPKSEKSPLSTQTKGYPFGGRPPHLRGH
jgi:regulator of replication initiation timing